MGQINDLVTEAHEIAIEKGWYDGKQPSFLETIALIHSELSEAVEFYREEGGVYIKGCGAYDLACESRECISCIQESGKDYDGKPEGIAVELADAVIRIFDFCGYCNIDLESIIRIKMDYNKQRPYRHGHKRI